MRPLVWQLTMEHSRTLGWGGDTAWRHHVIETLSVLLSLCDGNPTATSSFPCLLNMMWLLKKMWDKCGGSFWLLLIENICTLFIVVIHEYMCCPDKTLDVFTLMLFWCWFASFGNTFLILYIRKFCWVVSWNDFAMVTTDTAGIQVPQNVGFL